jgi:hypothetical protein
LQDAAKGAKIAFSSRWVPVDVHESGGTIMGWLVLALIVAIPATIPASAFGWLSMEYALGFIWAAFLLIAALGLSKVGQPYYRVSAPRLRKVAG